VGDRRSLPGPSEIGIHGPSWLRVSEYAGGGRAPMSPRGLKVFRTERSRRLWTGWSANVFLYENDEDGGLAYDVCSAYEALRPSRLGGP
jgi:hypothetical protein